jgi:sugar phosphate isomerase/epimerase
MNLKIHIAQLLRTLRLLDASSSRTFQAFCVVAALTAVIPGNAHSAETQSKGFGMTNNFFAMDTGVHGEGLETPAAKAKFLKALGFSGIGWTPPAVDEMLPALQRDGLKMETLYLTVRIGEGEKKFDPQIPKYIQTLKGQGTILWVTISAKSLSPSDMEGDTRAVESIREISEMADAAGLRVALYPHAGAWLERVQDAVRIVKKVERKNVGVTFNLCHCLRVGDEAKIPNLLKEIAPHLFVVTINGADHEGGWGKLIQPLDQGAFDVTGFLAQLKTVNFTGPVGLQLYGVKGDARENLRRSMIAWRKLAGG